MKRKIFCVVALIILTIMNMVLFGKFYHQQIQHQDEETKHFVYHHSL